MLSSGMTGKMREKEKEKKRERRVKLPVYPTFSSSYDGRNFDKVMKVAEYEEVFFLIEQV